MVCLFVFYFFRRISKNMEFLCVFTRRAQSSGD